MSAGRGQAISLQSAGDVSPITVIIPGFVDVVATDIMGNWYRVTRPNADTFKPGKVHATARGVGSTNTIKFDVMVSTDHGATWNTALNSGTKITLPISVHYSDLPSLTWVITDFHDGDLIRIDLLVADPAAYGVSFQIFPL